MDEEDAVVVKNEKLQTVLNGSKRGEDETRKKENKN